MIADKRKNILWVIAMVIIIVAMAAVTFMQDRTAPQIYIPEQSISYEEGDTIEKLLEGCIATDDKDGDISEKIQIASADFVDDGTKLKLTYIVYDSNKNVNVAIRVIDYAGGDMSVFEVKLEENVSQGTLENNESIEQSGNELQTEETILESNSSQTEETTLESNLSQTEDGTHEHVYEESAKKEATVLEAGFVTYQCACGDSYTEELEKIRLVVPVLQELKVENGHMVVSWEEVPGATGYVVYRLGNNKQWVDLATVESGITYVDTKIEHGKTYTYTVKAFAKTSSGIVWGSYNRIGVTKTVE